MFRFNRMESDKTTAHQRLIFKVQKPVDKELLIFVKILEFFLVTPSLWIWILYSDCGGGGGLSNNTEGPVLEFLKNIWC